MKADNLQTDTSSKNSLKFLAGWSLFTSVVIICLIIAVLAFVLPASRPNPLGDTYFELMAAGHSPTVYHLAIMFDVAAWIGWGGLLCGFAVLLRRLAPVRSSLVEVLAAGMSVGFIGACLRIAGTSKLASQYFSASVSQQASVAQSYSDLLQIINISFSAGGLLAGIGLLLVASARRYLPTLPRWTILLLGIGAAIHVMKAVGELATGADLGPLALLANLILIVALLTISRKFYGLSRANDTPVR